MKKTITRLINSLVICQLAGLVGAVFTTPAIPSWYANLNKPPFNPPNWVFGPVWTTLYLLMGISLFLVIGKETKVDKKQAYFCFAAQLVLNTFWSVVFFGWQQPLAAFLVILVLLTLIILTTIQFYKIAKPAAYLFIPYILWVSFATILNLSIVALN